MTAVATIRRGLRLTPDFGKVIRWFVLSGVLMGLGRAAVPVLFQTLLDRGLLDPEGIDPGELSRLALITAAVVIAVDVSAFVVSVTLARVAERALAGLRATVLRRALDLSLAEHAVERQGDLVSRTTGDVEQLTRFLDWGAYAWLHDLTIAFVALVVMFVYSPVLAFVALVTLLLMVPVLLWLQRRALNEVNQNRDAVSEMMSEAAEALAGAEVVRGFGQQRSIRSRINDRVAQVYRTQLRTNRYASVLFPVADVFGTLASVAIILTAVTLGADGPGLGTTIAVLFLLQVILNPVAEITEVIDQTNLALAGWRRIMDLATREQAIADPADPVDAHTVGSGPLDVELSEVTFGYGATPVLSDVNLALAKGTSTAIVGETGSGKTTLARLLCRLADPDRGTVRLGGIDLRDLARPDRAGAVRMIPQDGFLFAESIADNVARGRSGATPADIDQAIDELGLRHWIESQPDGLDTVLGPGGDGLSVGERQLVALIRAALADPGVLILDEATSSLDPATELAMTEALDRLKVGRTTITIAHRLSTAERADHVVVMDAGRVVEQGSHHELLTAGGTYAQLYAAWTRGIGNTAPS